MSNIPAMMRQMQEMQAKMNAMQQRLEETEITGSAGNGLVTVFINGKGEMKKIKLDPTIVDPSDVETLEDLIVAGCNDARTKMESAIGKETEQMMGGLQLPPGMKLPF
jgi:DNA-binding YbaB/EbfC family protein